MELESFLGINLIRADGSEIKTSDISTDTGSVLGLFFSGHWSPTCRKFTPQLADVYENLKKAGQNFEVVFISSKSDTSRDEFETYLKEMPWIAIPFENKKMMEACEVRYDVYLDVYDVYFSPCLVLIEPETGNIISNGIGF